MCLTICIWVNWRIKNSSMHFLTHLTTGQFLWASYRSFSTSTEVEAGHRRYMEVVHCLLLAQLQWLVTPFRSFLVQLTVAFIQALRKREKERKGKKKSESERKREGETVSEDATNERRRREEEEEMYLGAWRLQCHWSSRHWFREHLQNGIDERHAHTQSQVHTVPGAPGFPGCPSFALRPRGPGRPIHKGKQVTYMIE